MKTATTSYGLAVDLVEQRGEVAKAAEIAGWNGVGALPEATADARYAFGCIAAHIGEPGAQGWAKDLFSESARGYQADGQIEQAEKAQIRLAVCYWREGQIENARAMLESLSVSGVSSEVKAEAGITLAALAVHNEQWATVLEILKNVEPFMASQRLVLTGCFHNQRGIALEEMGDIDRAIQDFTVAGDIFETCEHRPYEAKVSNNLAVLYPLRSEFGKAHAHADRAITVYESLHLGMFLARATETKATIFLTEHKYSEALKLANRAIEIIERQDERGWLAESLRTRARILLGLDKRGAARADMERAVSECEEQGNSVLAGSLCLTMLEELDLGLADYSVIYKRADDVGADAIRLARCARMLADKVDHPASLKDLQTSVRSHSEADLIKRALLDAGGDLKQAAERLGLTRPGLAYKLKAHHPELLKHRKPARRRSIIKR